MAKIAEKIGLLSNHIRTNILKMCKLEKRIAEKRYLKKFFKRVYNFTSVVSTFSVFFGVVLFFIGKITSNNQSDNDLIMQQVRNEVGDATITSIYVADIHGFGNDSIVVTASEENIINGQGELIILDSVNNKILSEMNDPLGLKSSYKTTFSQKLSAEGQGLIPYNVEFINVDNSPAKELIVQYMVWGSTYYANYPAIYRYSYESEEYELFGTLPIPYYIDNKFYGSDGEVIGYQVIYENTTLDGYVPIQMKSDYFHSIISDGKREYDLPVYSDSCNYYWTKMEDDYSKNDLVVVYKNYDTGKYGINIYYPCIKDGKLTWGLTESIDDVEFSGRISNLSVQTVLDNRAYEKWNIE